jgi:hypothetical protein
MHVDLLEPEEARRADFWSLQISGFREDERVDEEEKGIGNHGYEEEGG